MCQDRKCGAAGAQYLRVLGLKMVANGTHQILYYAGANLYSQGGIPSDNDDKLSYAYWKVSSFIPAPQKLS